MSESPRHTAVPNHVAIQTFASLQGLPASTHAGRHTTDRELSEVLTGMDGTDASILQRSGRYRTWIMLAVLLLLAALVRQKYSHTLVHVFAQLSNRAVRTRTIYTARTTNLPT